MTLCLFIQLLTFPIMHVGRLELTTESKNAIHLSVLRGALVSCTISVPDGSTVGIYFHLDLSSIGESESILLIIINLSYSLYHHRHINKLIIYHAHPLHTYNYAFDQGAEDLLYSIFLVRPMHF